MKYNNIFKISAMCLSVFALTACSDWLDTKTDSQLPEDVTYESVADIQLAANGLYADLCADPYNQLQTIHQGAGTDCELIDGLGTDAESGETERAGMNYNATPGWAKIGTLWEKQYKTIEDCNRIIQGINNSSLKDDDDVMIASAEARVIRAMVYLDLVRVFGDIPFRWDAAKSDLSNVNQGKTDRDVILDAIAADLEEVVAEGKLPWCGEKGRNQDHINMGYAKGLLANIYMTRAGYAIRENERHQEAIDGGYSSQSKIDKEGYQVATSDAKDTKARYSDDNFKTLRPSDADCKVYYWKAAKQLNDIITSNKHRMNETFADFWESINQLRLDPKYESMFEIPMGFGLTGELGYTVGVRIADVTDEWGFNNSSGKLKTTAVQLYSYAPCDTRRDITCAAFTIRAINRIATVQSNMEVDASGIPYADVSKEQYYVNGEYVKELPADLPANEIAVKTEEGSGVAAERMLGNSDPFKLYIGKWDVRKMSDQWRNQNKISSLKFGYGINVVRMRYPQILLWYAECVNYLAEYGKPDVTENFNPDEYLPSITVDMDRSVAKQCIYDVHDRAYKGAQEKSYNGKTKSDDAFWDKLTNASDYESVLDMIDLENRLEFCGECFRKWDLIRWNRLHYNIWKAKKDYARNKAKKIFQDKVYFKYKDYEVKSDGNGGYYYWAPEKLIDMNSITWYGTNATNTETGTAPNNAWINENGYRYKSTTIYNPKDGKGYKFLGFGKEHKDINERSYAQDAFGKDKEGVTGDLKTICCGLVGKGDVTDVIKTGDEDDVEVDNLMDDGIGVKNCYLMPIGTLVIQSSNGRLYNSYKWDSSK